MQQPARTDSTFTLFAYGSCMNMGSLSATIGVDASSFFLGAARLPGWRVTFDYPSTNGTDYFCNLTPTENECTYGGLFRLPHDHLDAIRVREAWHKRRYREERLRVQTLNPDATHVDALVYLANVVVPSEGSPGQRYSQLVLDGARQCGLPFNYIESLRARMERLNSIPVEVTSVRPGEPAGGRSSTVELSSP